MITYLKTQHVADDANDANTVPQSTNCSPLILRAVRNR